MFDFSLEQQVEGGCQGSPVSGEEDAKTMPTGEENRQKWPEDGKKE